MKITFNRNHHFLLTLLCFLFIAISMLLNGCSTTDSNSYSQKIVDVIIKPEQAHIKVGEKVDFSVVAVTAAGDEIPVPQNFTSRWSSTNTNVFTVDDMGTATARTKRSAYCVIEVSGQEEANSADNQITPMPGRIRVSFTGRDSAFVSVP